ncbi:hypothetical protein EV181_003696, partial [Coemansia sp. RSA 532]
MENLQVITNKRQQWVSCTSEESRPELLQQSNHKTGCSFKYAIYTGSPCYVCTSISK